MPRGPSTGGQQGGVRVGGGGGRQLSNIPVIRQIQQLLGGGRAQPAQQVAGPAGGEPSQAAVDARAEAQVAAALSNRRAARKGNVFGRQPDTGIQVNRYLWHASLDVLSFLPVQSVDPFTGVFVTDWGAPPGGSTAYKATVLVQEPALDARSLKVALSTRSGPVDRDTIRAVEDAILTRARQLRIEDGKY
ncbi:DUF3576 domain-containing protein [Maritimibacter sp. 55A14]|nr:DUF3576 domain-containing protein [Maritimibacter sp. 55A14]